MVATVVVADTLDTKIQIQLHSCHALSCNKGHSPQGRQLAMSVQVNHSERHTLIFGLIWNMFSEESFCFFLKCLHIQCKTELIYVETFLINDSNDLSWLPFQSFPEFYILYKLVNKKVHSQWMYCTYTSAINICGWIKDPWIYTSPLRVHPTAEARQQSLIRDPG